MSVCMGVDDAKDRSLHVLFEVMTQSWGQDPYVANDEEGEEAFEEPGGEPSEEPEPSAPSAEADRGAGPSPEGCDGAGGAGSAQQALDDELASLEWQLRVMQNLSTSDCTRSVIQCCSYRTDGLHPYYIPTLNHKAPETA